MFQMYMPMAQQRLAKAQQDFNERKALGYYNNDTPEEAEREYINFIVTEFEKTTNKTIGAEDAEGKNNIAYVLTRCLAQTDPLLAEKVKKRLDFKMTPRANSGNKEAICQKYFHYNKGHVENTLEMIEKYHQSLGNNQPSILSKDVLDLIPILELLSQPGRFDDATKQVVLQELESTRCNLSTFCDDIEMQMREVFLSSFNTARQQTVDHIAHNPSRLTRMKGKPFNLLIHSSESPEDFLNNTSNFNPMFSTTLIDERNIKGYAPGEVKFAFYQQIPQDMFIASFSGDASTSFDDDGILSTPLTRADYTPVDTFKSTTRDGNGYNGYSEIMIRRGLKPDAIVCYDRVTERERQIADQYNLDIILIETEYYNDMVRNDDISRKAPCKLAVLSDLDGDYELE